MRKGPAPLPSAFRRLHLYFRYVAQFPLGVAGAKASPASDAERPAGSEVHVPAVRLPRRAARVNVGGLGAPVHGTFRHAERPAAIQAAWWARRRAVRTAEATSCSVVQAYSTPNGARREWHLRRGSVLRFQLGQRHALGPVGGVLHRLGPERHAHPAVGTPDHHGTSCVVDRRRDRAPAGGTPKLHLCLLASPVSRP